MEIKFGKTFSPKKKESSENELVGNYWRAWLEDGKYFYEFDNGHFSSQFKRFEITKEEFSSLKENKINLNDFKKKYEF